MPSRHTSGTRHTDRPTFPKTRETIGEDPARFLCTDLSPWPMLRGMTDPQRAAAWLAVARKVDADSQVVKALERLVERLREASET
jgi:hypothetical protein